MKIQIQINPPLWSQAGTLSNMSKIVETDGIPRKGDQIGMPGKRIYTVDYVRFRYDGHVSVHIAHPAQILELTTDGGVEGVRHLAEDLLAAGYTGISQWDNDEEV